MWKRGDAIRGFEVEVESKDPVLKLRVWGLWDDALGRGYLEDMRLAFARVEPKKPWYVLADIREYPAQSQSVAAVHGQLMAEATARGMKRAVSVVASSLTQLQIRRLAEESHMPELAFYKEEPTARAWLLSK